MRKEILLVALSGSIAACQPTLRDQVATAQRSTFGVVWVTETPTSVRKELHGSAVAIAPDLVVTCAHVMHGMPADTRPMLARDADGENTTLAAVHRMTEFPAYDLAVLEAPGLGARPARIRTDDIEPGDEVFWVGHPFGLSPTVRAGIVSSVSARKDNRQLMIDGAVNAGDSGGALFSRKDGNVVGILVATHGGLSPELLARAAASTAGDVVLRRTLAELDNQIQVGIGYAIPARDIEVVLGQFEEEERARERRDLP